MKTTALPVVLLVLSFIAMDVREHITYGASIHPWTTTSFQHRKRTGIAQAANYLRYAWTSCRCSDT